MQERVKPKTRMTVELDATLVAVAKAKGVDFAMLFEQALEAHVNASRSRPLNDEDQASMESYNSFIAEQGTLADAFRKS